MFHQARVKLTLLYSIIFLVLFWGLSFGVYFWMNRYFGDEHGRTNDFRIHHERSLLQNSPTSTEPISDIIMDDLRNILITIDIILLFSIPTITWFLTGNTLKPVQQSHERERQFFTDASHDLRTPLSILKGEIDLSLKKERTKQEYRVVLQSNKEEIDDLINLVENMLFFARENKKSQIVQKEQVDVTDIVTGRIVVFQKSAKQKKIQLSFIPAQESTVILGNTQLLKRLFTSLLDNAIKYTPTGGKITVKIFKEKNLGTVTISDTGIGIPNDQQEKVFDRFFRTDSSRTEKGYGLGLSIAKQIVESHQGQIHLTSQVGKGTTLIVSFPLVTQNQGKSQS